MYIFFAASPVLPDSCCDEGAGSASRHLLYDPQCLSQQVPLVCLQKRHRSEEKVERARQEEGGASGQHGVVCH